MKYIGLVLRPVSGTKFATVKIISAAKGVPIPDGKVLLEVSRAEDFYDCYITFDKIMPKGFGSAQIICSKFYRTDSPQPEEKKPEPKKKLSPEPQPKHLPAPELKPEPAPEPKPEPETAAEPEPDVEKLQQQVVSLRGNLTDKDITIDKLKKKIATLEKKLFDQKEMDKLNLGGNEELFSGEKKDFVLMALAEELEGLEPRTRRYDVLKGILDSNDKSKHERICFDKSAFAFGNFYRCKYPRGTICARNKGFYIQIGDCTKRVLRNGILDGIAF